MRHLALSLPVPLVVIAILSFMEGCRQEVQDTVSHVSTHLNRDDQKPRDSRADYRRDKSAPWQTTVLIARDYLTGRAETSAIPLATRCTGATAWPSENGNGNKSAYEAQIQDH